MTTAITDIIDLRDDVAASVRAAMPARTAPLPRQAHDQIQRLAATAPINTLIEAWERSARTKHTSTENMITHELAARALERHLNARITSYVDGLDRTELYSINRDTTAHAGLRARVQHRLWDEIDRTDNTLLDRFIPPAGDDATVNAAFAAYVITAHQQISRCETP